MHRRRAPLHQGLVLTMLLVALAGCDGLTCSGQGFEFTTQTTFPEAQIVDPALKLRVTREGSDFAQAHGPELLQGLLGSGDAIGANGWIDISDLLNGYLEQNPVAVLGISARELVGAARLPDPQGLQIQFLSGPTRVRVIIDELWLRIEATVTDDNTGAACRIRGQIEPGPDERMFTIYDMVLDLELAVTADGGFDVSTELVSLDIAESSIDVVTDPADAYYYCNYPECQDGNNGCDECESVCGAADFIDDVANYFLSAFDQVIAAAVEFVADTVLDELERLGGRIHPALLLGSLLDDLYDAEHLAFGVRPSQEGFSITERPDKGGSGGDLNVSLAMGVMADRVHPCVPPPAGPEPVFTASVLGAVPSSASGSELVLGVPAGLVDQALWGLYHSGALCLEIDAATVADLTGGAIDLSAGLLSLLLPGLETLAPADAPLLVVLRPSLVAADLPVVRFGNGEVRADGSVDSLIQVGLRGSTIGIYAGIDDHYVQLFEVRADLAAGVTPLVMPDSSLGVGIDSLEVTNLVETYDELFADVELQKMLRFVVELLGRVLVGNELSLPLPLESLVENLLGVPLRIGFSDFASAGPGGDWLTLSIGLEYDGSGSSGGPVETRLAEPVADALRLEAGSSLALTLEPGRDGAPLEAQYRIDGLAWTGFRPGPQLIVASPLLELPGEHTLELRARVPGRHATTDASPLRITLEVVAPGEAPLTEPPPGDAAHDDGGGCSVVMMGRGQGALGGLALCAALLCLGLRRRRWSLLAVLAALGAGGCAETPVAHEQACDSDRDCGQGQYCGCDGVCVFPMRCASSADCCGGRACADGFCEARFECRDDADCAAGFACEGCQCQRAACASDTDCAAHLSCRDGLCAHDGSIPCGAACEDGEVCLVERDVCIAATNVCPQLVCAPGELAALISAEGYLGEQCSFDDTACGCVVSPPLPPPRPGGYVAAVEAGGEVIIAAYEPHFGDLVAVRANADLKLTGIEFVDGVPAVRPSAAVDGPRGGIAVPGPDVGRHAAAAVAPDGTVALAGYDAAGGLRMAVQRPGQSTWTRFTLDEAGDAGRFASLGALSDSRFVVAYQVLDEGANLSMLRIAVSNGPAPDAASDFLVSNAEVAPLGDRTKVCGGACADDEVCVASTMACARPEPAAACAQSCEIGTVCIAGACEAIVSGARDGALVSGTGVDPHVVALTDGLRVAVPFYRAEVGELALAVGPASGPFEVMVVDAGSNRAGFGPTDVGRQVSAGVDSRGRLHLAYLDGVSGELLYATWSFSGATLTAREVVAAGLAGYPASHVGGVDLALGSDGSPRIAWQDTATGTLWLARRGVDGGWTSQAVDEVDVAGFSPSFTDSGRVLAFGRIRVGAPGAAPFREVGLVSVP